MPDDEISVVLSNSRVAVSAIKESVLPEGKNVEVLTIQSIKGLEAQNVIIHKQIVPEVTQEPNYDAVFDAIKQSGECGCGCGCH